MTDHAYIGELLAGIFYFVAGVRLLRLASRTGEAPERLLGLLFLFAGISYLVYQLAIPAQTEALWVPLNFAGRVALVGCPKLDDIAYYREKLAAIFHEAGPKSITVLRMEVPCCSGLAHAVAEARNTAAPAVPVTVDVIGIRGDITSETIPAEAGG